MRLAEFILHDMEAILEEWEAFAATLLPAAAGMSPLALRDDAPQILRAIAKDISTPQTREAQAEKSRGRAPTLPGAPETAAQAHGLLRGKSGFDIGQLVAEYRALRASVLRLWIDSSPADQVGLEDVIRFNEAIDQAVAESVGRFQAQVERARNLLLGMLSHDMRSPLNTMVGTAAYLAALDAGPEVSVAADRLVRSGASIQALLEDLADFNRTKLGLGLQVLRADVDLGAVVADEVEQLRGAYPHARLELATTGAIRGRWDGRRLQQLLRNLVLNAIRYGARDTAIRVRLHGGPAEVRLEVTNSGPAIAASDLSQIFDPLKRASAVDGGQEDRGLGLGLYIVREIVHAHAGSIEVRCEGGETTFAVRLPR